MGQYAARMIARKVAKSLQRADMESGILIEKKLCIPHF